MNMHVRCGNAGDAYYEVAAMNMTCTIAIVLCMFLLQIWATEICDAKLLLILITALLR